RNMGEHEFNDGFHSKDYTNGVLLHTNLKTAERNKLTAGAEFRQQGGELLHKPFMWESPEIRQKSKYEIAVFLYDEQTLLDRLIISGGVRYNLDEISGDMICSKIGMVLELREGTLLRAQVNEGFRSPQLNDLYFFKASNDNLKPETARNYEAGVNQQIIKKLNIDLAGYLMKGKNLIMSMPNPSPPPMALFENTGEFEFKGIEAGIKAGPFYGLSIKAYYTYLNAGENTRGRPGDKMDVSLRYKWKKLKVSLATQSVFDYFAADSSKEWIEDYTLTNAKVSYTVITGLDVFAALDNMFNTDYAIYANITGDAAGVYKMPGTAFTGGFTYKF
ncbi:MAG: TonB-dependent receptor, partial [bacterium]